MESSECDLEMNSEKSSEVETKVIDDINNDKILASMQKVKLKQKKIHIFKVDNCIFRQLVQSTSKKNFQKRILITQH